MIDANVGDALVLKSCAVPIVTVLPEAVIDSPYKLANVMPPLLGDAVVPFAVIEFNDAFALAETTLTVLLIVFALEKTTLACEKAACAYKLAV